MKLSYRSLERLDVSFDDEHLVAGAGLLLVSTLMGKLELEKIIST